MLVQWQLNFIRVPLHAALSGICEVIERQTHLQRKKSFISFNEIASSEKLLIFF